MTGRMNDDVFGIAMNEWRDAPLPPPEFQPEARAWLGGCYGARSGAANPYRSVEPSRAWQAGCEAQRKADSA